MKWSQDSSGEFTLVSTFFLLFLLICWWHSHEKEEGKRNYLRVKWQCWLWNNERKEGEDWKGFSGGGEVVCRLGSHPFHPPRAQVGPTKRGDTCMGSVAWCSLIRAVTQHLVRAWALGTSRGWTVTLGKLVNFSGPQFLHLEMEAIMFLLSLMGIVSITRSHSGSA